MTSIAKLKDKARKHEQKENWQAAIEVYQKVLDQQDENENLDLDLGLYNRIGDLNLRIGQTDAAVSYYEQAADKYAESGFYNNAIALCNKALRHRPDRASIYLKLSRLCTEQGFQTDARRWILEYAERKVAAGQIEDALSGLEEFAELSEDPEIREMLAQRLASHGRDEEAVEQLRTAYTMRVRAGEPEQAAAVAEKAREIDPEADLEAEAPAPLPGLDTEDEPTGPGAAADEEPAEPAGAAEEVEGAGVADELETTVADVDAPAETEAVEGLETGDDVAADIEADTMEGLEPGAGVAGGAEEGTEAEEVEGLEGLESTAADIEVDRETAAEVSGLDVSYGEQEPATDEAVEAGAVGGLETFDRDEAEGAEAGAEAGAADATVEGPPGGEGEEGSQDFETEEEAEPLPLLETEHGEDEDVEAAVAAGAGEEVAAEDELEEDDLAEEPVEEEERPEVEPAAAGAAGLDAADTGPAEETGAIEPELAEPVEAETEAPEGPEAPVDAGEADVEPAGIEPEIPVETRAAEVGAEEAEPVEGLDPAEIAEGEADLEAGAEDEAAVEVGDASEGFETTAVEEEAESGELELSFEGARPLEAEPEPVPEHLDVEGAFDLNEIDLGFSTGDESADGPVEDLDIEAVLERARSLVSRALTDQALRELNLLSGTEAGPDTFEDALAVVNEILRHNPNDIEALQRRVEYAERIGERQLQVDVHLDLAEALERVGSDTKARAMYQRALELDPSNEVAREALALTDEEEASGEEEEAVDLNALVREMAPEGLEEAAGGAGETDPDFAAMLDQFRAKVAENVAPEDADDHYDLGLAFKEMGLIDEAIAEFQTALTAGEERLKVYEELGQCFVRKGQYNVAVKVFERALKVPHAEEEELLGVYYHLGQCYEELGRREDARAAYEKVLSIDETFADVPDRVARL